MNTLIQLNKISTLSLLIVVAFAGSAVATSQIGVTSLPIADGTFDEINVRSRTEAWKTRIDTNSATDLHVVQNTVIPGGTFGWHTHTGPSLVIVVAGAATMYEGDDPTCSPHVIQSPATFVDEGDPAGHLVRNEGDVDLVVIVVRLVPAGAVQRIDLPNPRPGVCPE